jgi:outer membrane protein OmpA-like peptidoglycan-associated protein
MLKKMFAAVVLAAVLGACETFPGASDEAASAFDPAACYEREFNVYFDGADATLTPEAREAIDAVGAALRGCRIDHVRIIGMADAALEAEISIEISEARARAIRDYLESEFRWDHDKFELRARGDRGAVTEEGLARPLRSRARVVATASAP